MRRCITAGLVAGSALALAVAMPAAQAAPPTTPGPPEMARVIIAFSPGVSATAGAAQVRAMGGNVEEVLTNVFQGVIANVPAVALSGLGRNPNVDVLELDGTVQATATQSPATWGLDRIDQRTSSLNNAYSYSSTGSGVTAYIVDTGIRADHTEFTDRLGIGYSTVADGGGTNDCNGHGTHVAGTVAGSTWGVAKAATVVPVRVLDCSGSGSWSGVVSGLEWVAGHHVAGAPAVANMSLGGGASLTVDRAVQGVINDGVTVVVAAGNSNADACRTSPARVSDALTIGATDSRDTKASFSNYGTCVDLFAPGVNITSAWIGGASATNTISGTSMASPHVSGAAALVLGASPSLTPAAVATAVKTVATQGVVGKAGRGSPTSLLYTGS